MKVLVCLVMSAALASAETVNYTYDDAGRLIRVDYGTRKSIAYTYDPAGNLLSRTVTSSGDSSAKPHAKSATGGKSSGSRDSNKDSK